jgi:hypothetical protein
MDVYGCRRFPEAGSGMCLAVVGDKMWAMLPVDRVFANVLHLAISRRLAARSCVNPSSLLFLDITTSHVVNCRKSQHTFAAHTASPTSCYRISMARGD